MKGKNQMKLGLNNNEVKVVPYTNEWHSEFIRIKKDILQHINIEENRIEHIGSTAITGMLAKPVLDIVVGVGDLDSFDSSIIQGLKSVGFLRLRVERPGEIVFARFTDDTYQEKTHYVHLVEYERDLWKNLIFFRDFLNSSETARNDYINLKVDFLKDHSTGIKEYTNHKENFVKSIFSLRTV